MATNSPNLISLPSARPETGVVYPANDSQIASAISRAQENLLGQQNPDGHWCGELYVDSTLCSDYVLYRSEEHTSELQSHVNLVCRLLLEKKNEMIWKNVTQSPTVSISCI